MRKRLIESIALLVVVVLAFHALEGCGGGGSSKGTGGSGGAGTTGSAGTTGGAGTTGSAGQGGAAGTNTGGTAGTSSAGTTGAAGAAGVAGTTGAAGITGASGTTGIAGAGGVPACTPTFPPLMQTAPAVPENRVAQAFTTSAAAGGTIPGGIFWLTSLSLYTGPAGATGPTGTTRRETLEFWPAKNTAEVVVQSSGSTTSTHLDFSTAVSGTSLSLTGTCPVSAPVTASYTATDTTVTLWIPSNGTNLPEVQVYTKADPFCTSTFPTTAPVVPLNRVAEAFPATAAGGTVVAGVYYLTALTQYTGPGGATGPSGMRSETLRLEPNTDEFVLKAAIAESKDTYGDWLFARVKVVASSLELTQVCPTAAMLSLPYTATPTTLVIYNAANGTVESYTFDRPP